jgi:hypothetical protein
MDVDQLLSLLYINYKPVFPVVNVLYVQYCTFCTPCNSSCVYTVLIFHHAASSGGCWDMTGGCWDTTGGCWDTTGGCWDTTGGCWDMTGGCWDTTGGCWDTTGGCWDTTGGSYTYVYDIYICHIQESRIHSVETQRSKYTAYSKVHVSNKHSPKIKIYKPSTVKLFQKQCQRHCKSPPHKNPDKK